MHTIEPLSPSSPLSSRLQGPPDTGGFPANSGLMPIKHCTFDLEQPTASSAARSVTSSAYTVLHVLSSRKGAYGGTFDGAQGRA